MDEIKNSINIPVIPISYGDARELLEYFFLINTNYDFNKRLIVQP